jgi:rod shape-determining protein MreC
LFFWLSFRTLEERLPKGKGVLTAIIAMIIAVLWMVCGRYAAAESVYPIENGRNWFIRNLVVPFKALFSASATARENRLLRDKLNKALLECEDSNRLREENSRLRALLEYPPAVNGVKWLAAPVLSSGGTAGAMGILRVGKGSLAGVKEGACVVVPEGVVGRVVEVTAHTAVVRLLTSELMRIACEIETGDPSFGKVRGIVYGGGLGKVRDEKSAGIIYVVNPLLVRHLQRDVKIPLRARIVTSGLGGVFPRGITIGYLADKSVRDETQLECEGDVIPSVDLAALEDVFIRCEK